MDPDHVVVSLPCVVFGRADHKRSTSIREGRRLASGLRKIQVELLCRNGDFATSGQRDGNVVEAIQS
jgi:hypothetical protein